MEFMVGCWAIWERRNKAVFEDGEWRADWVVKRARDMLEEIWGVGANTASRRPRVGGGKGGSSKLRVGEQWVRPPDGVHKVNVDAGFVKGEGVGWGAMCRSWSGTIEWAVKEQDKGDVEPKVAEALTIFHGLSAARRMGVKDLIVESDCLNVVEDLKKRRLGRGDIFLIYNDIFSLCSFFYSCSFVFASRNLNSVAHALVHFCPWSVGRRMWLHDVPCYITALAEADLVMH
ncbi:uncharacterized protein LOC141640529 [Silene latifolia]|uniref:uncharacterized protein LOC141640529 n=1 Tax=Silene latifolia TaxID=37657 RepID=UPI003D78A3FC